MRRPIHLANTLRAGVVVLAILVPACSETPKESGNGEAVAVELETARKQTVIRSLAYDGDVEAELEVQVFSRVTDRIERMAVDVGDRVQKGTHIARIRATAIEQSVRQAEAALAAARSQEANLRLEFERSTRLFRENALSQQQLDAVRTQFEAVTAQREQAEAMVTTARSQLTDALITAPIAGIVASRNYEAGDMASPARPLVTIVQMNRVKVAFDVAEAEIGMLKTGQDAEIRVKSYGDRVFHGRVAEISPVLDRVTRMGRVEVFLENPGSVLKPGMFARVQVRIGSINSIVVVPRHAVTETSALEMLNGKEQVVKHYTVYVAKGDRVEQRTLTVAHADHEILAVTGGLSEGERYVSVGQHSLRDGSRILVATGKDTVR